jgi:hypothetical protein
MHEANMTTRTNDARRDDVAGAARAALDGQYGKIGISAVAAAVRYQGDSKNSAYAPSSQQIHRWDLDSAA